MRRVATGAAFGFDGHVLVDKRPLFFAMTAEAGGIAAGRLAQLARGGIAMHIVAIAAFDQPFVDAMAIRAREFGTLARMARVTEIGLLLDEQMLAFGCVMWAVAIEAAHLIAQVRRIPGMALGNAFAVTLEALLAGFCAG